MSKFKEGDKLRVIRRAAHWMNNDKRPKVGDIVEVSEADTTGVYFPWGEEVAYGNDENFELPEDRTAEIADIERKMRELSESQKELADRLDKLKQ